MEDDQAYEEDDSTSSAGVCTACGSLVERPITLDTMVADARSMLEGAVPGSRVKVELRVGGVTEAPRAYGAARRECGDGETCECRMWTLRWSSCSTKTTKRVKKGRNEPKREEKPMKRLEKGLWVLGVPKRAQVLASCGIIA